MGCDSFSNHVAGAYGTPAVILFGSTSPTGSGYKTATNIYKGIECQPCYKENPEVSKNPRGSCDHRTCMKSISVDEVIDAAKKKIYESYIVDFQVINEAALIKDEVKKDVGHLFNNPSTIIDIGSGGNSVFLNAITIDNRHLPGVDFVGDAKCLHWFDDFEVDLCFSSHCLEDFEHEDKIKAIKEWTRVLKRGGHLALYLPDQARYVKHCERYGKYINKDHKDPNFSIETLRQIVKDSVGEDIEEIRSIENHAFYSFYVIYKKK